MARVIVNNTRFTPFTFEEMLRPIAMYGQEYRAQEDALSELAIKANVFEGMANEQTDPYAYKIYKKYADDLESQAGQLSREGLSLSSRKNMLQMRERYSKEITPIEVAYKRREELAAEQRKAIAANPTLRYQRMASAMSLDDFIKNPSLDYGESYSGALLTQQVAQAAANYAKVLTEEGGLEKLELPFQYKSKIRHGASPEEILAVINNAALDGHQGAVNFLRTIRDQVMQSSGVADWADSSTLREFTSFANQGLYSALGQTEIKNYTDQFSMSDALNARQHARQVAAQQAQERRDNRLNPLALRSKEQIDAANKTINAYVKAGYFVKGKNGHYVMTEKGRKAYYHQEDVYETKMSGSGMNMTPVTYKTGKKKPSAFRTFMDKLGGAKYTGKNSKGVDSIQPGNMGLLFEKYVEDNQATSYDTYHTTEYDRQLDGTYGDTYLQQIKTAASGNGKLSIVAFKGRKWTQTGTISIDDLKGYTVTNVRYSKYGNTAILQKSDGSGDPIRVALPAGIHKGAETNVSTAIRNADDWGHILSTGKRPKMSTNSKGIPYVQKDRSGNIIYTSDPLTDEDRAVFLRLQDEALSDMGSYGSQFVVTSKTKAEEYEPFNF